MGYCKIDELMVSHHFPSWNGHLRVNPIFRHTHMIWSKFLPNLQETLGIPWKVLRLLLHYRGSVNITDSAGRSPLWAASKHGHLLVAKQLLLEGSNVEIDGSVEGTALSVAAERGHKELVRWGVLLRCFGARNLAAKLLQVIVETYLLIAQGPF